MNKKEYKVTMGIKNQEKYRLWMVIGFYIAIILFILAVVALAKNVKEIKTDPILYGMERHDFDRCVCSNPAGGFTNIVLKDHVKTETSLGG